MATTLNFDDIFTDMVSAAKTVLGDKWPKLRDLATSSVKTLAQNIVDIEKMALDGTITKEQSILKISLQKDAFKILLLSEAGIALLLAEAVLNAVIDVVKTAINTAIGFVIL
jgi:basic membrane lipoprotein Med (substrate-binding protein (PBP1-ABC) superfamily)